jgi:hypothetical protein
MKTVADVALGYASISSRTSQLTLKTKSANFRGAPSIGTQLRSTTFREGSTGRASTQYYRGWKNSYTKGAFSSFLKNL